VDEHLHESDGTGTIRFVAPDVAPIQENGTARIIVMRTGGSDGQVSVNYATVNDTAVAGLHYAGRAGTLTFGPGEILKTIDIPLIDDAVFSGNTTFRLVLSDPAGTVITGPDSMIVSLRDDDPPPQFQAGNMTVTEGDQGGRQISFVVTISGATRVPALAKWGYRLAPYGEAQAVGTLTFTPGGPTSQTITIPYDGNRRPEEDRIFDIWLFDVVNALPTRVEQRVTIVDDDFTELTILDASVNEAKDRVSVAIAVTAASEKPVTVKFTTADGTATAGSDFTATTGTARFGRTDGRYFVNIPIISDSSAEGDETFTVVLSDVTNGRIRRGAATVVLIDDDAATARTPSLSAADVVAVEGVQTGVRFTVRLSFPVPHEVRFRAVTAAGTATATDDFRPLDQIFTIPAGSTDVGFNVDIPNDSLAEGAETFALTLSEAVGAVIARPTITATIRDTDSPPVPPNTPSAFVTDIQLAEGSGTARFTIRLSNSSTSPVTLAYVTADGSAAAPADYTAITGTVTFAPGETARNVDIPITADNEHEHDETFTLVLGNPVHVTISDGAATCRILNDDEPSPRRRGVRH
jgi:large repetitive protein